MNIGISKYEMKAVRNEACLRFGRPMKVVECLGDILIMAAILKKWW
jgi:hypothetical protein